jgi:hypothetical protein
VDLFGRGQDDECKKWALKAISLAHYHGDGGTLERNLQDNFALLKWDPE